jgi:hypothetical protein
MEAMASAAPLAASENRDIARTDIFLQSIVEEFRVEIRVEPRC